MYSNYIGSVTQCICSLENVHQKRSHCLYISISRTIKSGLLWGALPLNVLQKKKSANSDDKFIKIIIGFFFLTTQMGKQKVFVVFGEENVFSLLKFFIQGAIFLGYNKCIQ